MANKKSWTFDTFVEFTPDEDVKLRLQKMFLLEPRLQSVSFGWQSGGYDDSNHYGESGWIEYQIEGGPSKAEIALQNQAFAANAWLLQDTCADLAQDLCETEEGNSCELIALRDGHFVLVDDNSDLNDTGRLDDNEKLIDDGILGGFHIASPASPSAHEVIEVLTAFREARAAFAAHVDEIIKLNHRD